MTVTSQKSDDIAALRILYVDDDADDRDFFAQAIKKLETECQLTIVSNCMEAINLLEQSEKFDLLFLDINMPVIDGKACLQMLKSNHIYKDIPTIILTVSKSESEINEVYELGAHYHVIKPVAQINLVAALKIILSTDWRQPQPRPAKEQFVVNYSFLK